MGVYPRGYITDGWLFWTIDSKSPSLQVSSVFVHICGLLCLEVFVGLLDVLLIFLPDFFLLKDTPNPSHSALLQSTSCYSKHWFT